MYVDEKTLKDLEWATVLKHLSVHATNNMGKEKCLNLLPVSDIDDVKEMLNLTTEAKKMLQMALNPPFGGVYDISDLLRRSEIGDTLENKAFIDIGSTLLSAKNLKAFFNKHSEDYKAVCEIASYIMDHETLINEIYKCFDTSGNMLSTASVTLKHLRDSLRDQTNNLKDTLNSLLHSAKIANFLQEPVYTIRNDRYVLPVKAEHKSDVPGIVHDSSASGVTYYIEPRSIVDLNNKLKETELKIEHEIQKILSELTMKVAHNAEKIYITFEMLSRLDLIFAKAKYSSKIDAGEPEINTNKVIKLTSLRHPILVTTLKKVVPNTVEIGEDFNTLIITGANTGGKTVLLKAIGLSVLMASAGLHIPSDSDSTIHLFSSVFSDIGEEQSLEHNLSTFSAKMTNIINIVNKSDNNSLVLLDELGAGTDPAEGTSLAQAILENINNKGSTSVVTTHYGGLKTLAFTHEGFCNASVEFDFDSLQPTYRLLMGVPGKSNATTIAKNLGLAEDIVNRADEIYHSSIDDFSLTLDELQKVQREISKEYNRAKENHDLAELRRQEYEELLEKMKTSKTQSLNSFRRNLNSELNKAKAEVIDIMSDLKKEKTEKTAKRAHSELSNIGYKGQKKYSELKEDLQKREKPKPVNWNKIQVGDSVFVKKLGHDAIIVSLPDNQERVVVQMGLVKSTVKKDELELPKKFRQKIFEPKFKSKAHKQQTSRRENISINCDLRGKTVDDGLHELEVFLDKAALTNIPAVYIIHGHGTGVLRKAVREYLQNSPYVSDFRPGEQSEGGDGVSIVELK